MSDEKSSNTTEEGDSAAARSHAAVISGVEATIQEFLEFAQNVSRSTPMRLEIAVAVLAGSVEAVYKAFRDNPAHDVEPELMDAIRAKTTEDAQVLVIREVRL